MKPHRTQLSQWNYFCLKLRYGEGGTESPIGDQNRAELQAPVLCTARQTPLIGPRPSEPNEAARHLPSYRRDPLLLS